MGHILVSIHIRRGVSLFISFLVFLFGPVINVPEMRVIDILASMYRIIHTKRYVFILTPWHFFYLFFSWIMMLLVNFLSIQLIKINVASLSVQFFNIVNFSLTFRLSTKVFCIAFFQSSSFSTIQNGKPLKKWCTKHYFPRFSIHVRENL